MKNTIKYRLVAVAIFIAGLVARADTSAVSFDTSYYWIRGWGPGVFGWEFTPRSNIEVTALGLYDGPDSTLGRVPGDGLLETHAIGIWNVIDRSNPVTSSLIPSGTVAPLANGFRYVSINPLTLTAGNNYVIGVLNSYITNSSGVQVATDFTVGETSNPTFTLSVSPQIDFIGRRSVRSTTLVFPDNFQPGVLGDFGPNFSFAIIPEPSSLGLVALGSAALLGLRSLGWITFRRR